MSHLLGILSCSYLGPPPSCLYLLKGAALPLCLPGAVNRNRKKKINPRTGGGGIAAASLAGARALAASPLHCGEGMLAVASPPLPRSVLPALRGCVPRPATPLDVNYSPGCFLLRSLLTLPVWLCSRRELLPAPPARRNGGPEAASGRRALPAASGPERSCGRRFSVASRRRERLPPGVGAVPGLGRDRRRRRERRRKGQGVVRPPCPAARRCGPRKRAETSGTGGGRG